MKKLITFATLNEAASLIDSLQAKNSCIPNLYESDIALILITGMGILKAAIEISKKEKDISQVINLGAAGALSTLPLFSIHPISLVGKYVEIPSYIDEYSRQFSKKLFPDISLKVEGKRLLSTDFPLHHPRLKDQLAQNYDLIDMEGYGVVLSSKKVELWKIVSDFASFDGEKKIKDNLAQISWNLKEFAINKLLIQSLATLN